MIFKFLNTNEDGQTIYARIDDDGKCRLTCTAEYPEFQAWLAEGNEPLPADTTEETQNV
jgi:hypothetical protein